MVLEKRKQQSPKFVVPESSYDSAFTFPRVNSNLWSIESAYNWELRAYNNDALWVPLRKRSTGGQYGSDNDGITKVKDRLEPSPELMDSMSCGMVTSQETLPKMDVCGELGHLTAWIFGHILALCRQDRWKSDWQLKWNKTYHCNEGLWLWRQSSS